MTRKGSVLVDTGILVALLYTDDGKHRETAEWLEGCNAQFHTVEAVLTEASHFLPASQRVAIADLAARGWMKVHCPDAVAYRRIGAILQKYGDSKADWADATLVWLAEESGIHRIATFDVRDFSTYRIHGRGKFQVEPIQ